MKKILSAILSFFLLFSLNVVNVFAEDENATNVNEVVENIENDQVGANDTFDENMNSDEAVEQSGNLAVEVSNEEINSNEQSLNTETQPLVLTDDSVDDDSIILSNDVTNACVAESVVCINGIGYSSLRDALDAASNKSTLVLNKNYDSEEKNLVIEKDLTLDLNGNNLKISPSNSTGDNKNLQIGTLTVRNRGNFKLIDTAEVKGKLFTDTKYNNSNDGYGVIRVEGSGIFTLDGAIIDTALENPVSNGQFAVGVFSGGTVNINSGSIKAGWYAISGNGNDKDSESVININGGELISTADFAIYHPQNGSLNISGGTVNGAAGALSVNRGTLNITGGKLVTNGTGDTGAWSDGTSHHPAAAICLKADYGDVNLNIENVEILSEGAAKDFEASNNPKNKINCTVSNGSFSDTSVLDYTGENSIVSISLNKDVNDIITINKGTTVTLDLNGKVISNNEHEQNSTIVNKGNLTIKDESAGQPVVENHKVNDYRSGKVLNTYSKGAAVFTVDGGTFVLESGTLESTNNLGLSVHGDITPNQDNPVNSNATIKGGYIIAQEYAVGVYGKQAVINVEGGVLEAKDNAVVAGNGTKTANVNNGGTVMNITGGLLIGNIESSGYIAAGIYHPQDGEVNFGGTAEIFVNNGTGIIMRAGTLNATGGKITTTGTSKGYVGDNKFELESNAIILDKKANYPGSNSGSNLNAAVSGSIEIITDSNVANLSIITGDSQPSEEDKAKLDVTGGNFSNNVDDYVNKSVPSANNGKTFAVGSSNVDKLAKTSSENNPLIITNAPNGAISLPEGTVVKNETGSVIKVNGKNVNVDDTIVAPSLPSVKPEEPKNDNDKVLNSWDDGGPFTTDACGNVFDRWGNEVYHAPVCVNNNAAAGNTYTFVNTSDR